VELAQACLARIARFDSQLHSFLTLTSDLAMKQARRAEGEIAAGRYRNPLHGIPFGLKDIYNTAGIATTGNSRVCLDNVPNQDAATTTRLYDAGGVLLGKLATHEFAHGGPSHDLPWPLPRNPWDRKHFVGGSSSGSAAAVAAGFVLGALGSDTGASIRSPAALGGVAGLKPTYGLVSRRGVMPNSYTFDHCGPMAWTSEDCAILLNCIAGYDAADPTSADRPVPNFRASLNGSLRGLRVGVIRHFWEEDLPIPSEAQQAMEASLDTLTQLGARLETTSMRTLQEYYDVKIVIAETEIFCIHRKNLIERPSEFGEDFLRRTLAGCLFQASDYVQAQRERRRMLDEATRLYEKYDVLVTASSGPAPRLDAYQNIDFWRKPNLFTVFNVLAGPALSVCNGYSKQGLPTAMQIAGRPFDEQTVLRVGHAYEMATPWRERRPPLIEGEIPAPVTPPPTPAGPELDVEDLHLVESLARRAGLGLGERERRLLLEAAPYALAMAERIRRDHDVFEEPASTFGFHA
jgi:aspartyl-tRNA(Asn)/glutamyl-tRNA(Gln) amidotransferase subunit A